MLPGQKKGVSVYGGRKIIRSLTAVLCLHKGKLCQSKDTILIALGRQTRMHFRQRFLRIFFEALVQVQIDEFP